MTSTEHPVTRSELREELGQHRSELREELGQHQSEIREEFGQFRSELREELSHYATKSELREELSHYATKEDLVNLEIRLTREITGLRTEFVDFKGEIKTDVADLRAEVKSETNTLLKWMVGVQIGGIAAIAAITTAVIAIAKVIGI